MSTPGTRNAPVARVNTLAAVAVLSNMKETVQMAVFEIEQTVVAFVVAENGLGIDCPPGWHHCFHQGDNRFVDSNNYYS